MKAPPNWNHSARIVNDHGPQNPHKIHAYDDGKYYLALRRKAARNKKPYTRTENLVAIFTIKYAK